MKAKRYIVTLFGKGGPLNTSDSDNASCIMDDLQG